MGNETKKVIEVFSKYAAKYQEKFMDVGLYHESLDLFCSIVSKTNADILEVACGPGNITKYLLDKRPDFRILATDLSNEMLELAKNINPLAKFELLDCRNISAIEQQYDGFVCGFGLPYLTKEEAKNLIRDASVLLKTGGVVYISTMEDDYNKSGYEKASCSENDQLFIHYHQFDYLSETFLDSGFKMLDVRRKDYIENDGTITKDLLMLAQKI